MVQNLDLFLITVLVLDVLVVCKSLNWIESVKNQMAEQKNANMYLKK